jgi:hypothetical protein
MRHLLTARLSVKAYLLKYATNLQSVAIFTVSKLLLSTLTAISVNFRMEPMSG